MMIEVKIPTPGESINEVELATWLVADGDLVHRNQELALVESDKATLSLIAPESGKIEILVKEGETVKVNRTQRRHSRCQRGEKRCSIGRQQRNGR